MSAGIQETVLLNLAGLVGRKRPRAWKQLMLQNSDAEG